MENESTPIKRTGVGQRTREHKRDTFEINNKLADTLSGFGIPARVGAKRRIVVCSSGRSTLIESTRESKRTNRVPHFYISALGDIYAGLELNKYTPGYIDLPPEDFPVLNPDDILSREAIFIELINLGVVDRGEFTKYNDLPMVKREWRGTTRYWHSYTTKQLHACAWLIHYLSKSLHIPARLLPPVKRDSYCLSAVASFSGICGHYNFNSSRVDPGPLFNWRAVELYLAGHLWSDCLLDKSDNKSGYETTGPVVLSDEDKKRLTVMDEAKKKYLDGDWDSVPK